MNLKSILASSILLTSATSFAGYVKHGNLNVDQDSVRFVGDCSDADSFVSFNDDGSFDLVFTNLEAVALGSPARKTCMLKFNAKVPSGLTLAVSKVGIAGTSEINSEDGSASATLRHTLAGTVGDATIAEYKYDPSAGLRDVVLEKKFSVLSKSYIPCGKDVNFKTTISLSAKGQDADIVITEAAQKGKTYSVRYYWTWKHCS